MSQLHLYQKERAQELRSFPHLSWKFSTTDPIVTFPSGNIFYSLLLYQCAVPHCSLPQIIMGKGKSLHWMEWWHLSLGGPNGDLILVNHKQEGKSHWRPIVASLIFRSEIAHKKSKTSFNHDSYKCTFKTSVWPNVLAASKKMLFSSLLCDFIPSLLFNEK